MGTLLHCNVQSEYVLLWSPLTQGYIDCYNLTLVGIDNTTAEAFSEKGRITHVSEVFSWVTFNMSSSGFVTLRKHCNGAT